MSIFYVSPTGSDSNNGGIATPFQTIQHAVDKVIAAGDEIRVMAGNYAGFILGYDTPISNIIFTGLPGATIISRNGKQPTGIEIDPGCNGVTVQGFTVAQTDGSMTKAGIKSCSNNGKILNNTVVKAAGIGGIFTDNASNMLISGNISDGTIGTSTRGHGVYISGSCTGVQLINNILRNNQYHAVHCNSDASEGPPGSASGFLIANNQMLNNAANGINIDGLQNSIIQNNLITGCTKYGFSLYTIDSAVASLGNVFVNNTLDATKGAGIYEIQNGAIGNLFFNNIMLGKPGSVDSSSGVILSPANLIAATLPAGLLDANYKPIAGSAAIGKGVKSFAGVNAPAGDLLGLVDPSGGNDLGCYAFQGNARIPGDANGDGKVDFTDYQILESNMGKSGMTWAQGDFDGDGVVTYHDFQIWSANRGRTA